MKTKMRRYAVAVLLVGGCSLVSCGTQHADAARTDSTAPRASAADRECDVEDSPVATEDDQGLPDTTSDDQGVPDTTSDDQGLPDTTSDDYQELPDTTSDDQGPPAGDTTEDDQGVPSAGPHRWFSMTREFRDYLRTGAPKADAAIAAHVGKVCVRTPEGDGRTEADVWVDYGVWEDDKLNRATRAFAHWRQSVYGDHGHVTVLAPAKMDAERSW
ncbi:hypothetical protein AB0B40_07925 [Streptomyces sp. NPDC042638]|uniref:hypothetical protein n=1 Tax=Streptomyces sp. NPDC042638 TaxID=3154333 RepID=UPI0033FEBD00